MQKEEEDLNVIIPDSTCVTKHKEITCFGEQHNMEVHFKDLFVRLSLGIH